MGLHGDCHRLCALPDAHLGQWHPHQGQLLVGQSNGAVRFGGRSVNVQVAMSEEWVTTHDKEMS